MAARLSVELAPRLLTVLFPPSVDLSTKLTELVTAERECCGFVEWAIEDRDGELRLIVRGDADGVLALAESFGVSL